MSYETNVTDFAGLQSLMTQMGSDTVIAFDPWNNGNTVMPPQSGRNQTWPFSPKT